MRDGAPWFVAKDVCDVLGLDVSDTRRTLDESDREFLLSGQYPGLPNRGAIAINESGLYSLILKSRKPEARAFKKWATLVVLPAIRKVGAYVVGEWPPH
jgi:anti-repressor protein